MNITDAERLTLRRLVEQKIKDLCQLFDGDDELREYVVKDYEDLLKKLEYKTCQV